MIKVWHAKKPNFGLGQLIQELPDPEWPDGYELVAEIACGDPETAFALSQHITDHSWLKGERVFPKVEVDVRSTSVGDILEDQGELYRVEMVGLSRLENGDWIPNNPATRTLIPPNGEDQPK